MAAWRQADQHAAPLFDINRNLARLQRSGSDEGLMGTLVGSASGKSGNARLLATLRGSMPAQDFQRIAAVALHELGAKPTAPGGFSLNQFSSNWAKMSNQAKAALFSPQHRRYIDDIADLGNFLKDADKYANSSHSGGAIGMTALGTAIGVAGTAVMSGNFLTALATAAGASVPMVMSAIVARPASAAALARWARVLREQAINGVSPKSAASLKLAERGVIANLPDMGIAPRAQAIAPKGGGPKGMPWEGANVQRTAEGYPFVTGPTSQPQTTAPPQE